MVTLPQLSIDTENIDNCFGCGKNNPIGLKLNFQRDGKAARAEFTPAEIYQGWSGVVHGGIVMAILDEAISHAALFEGMNCVTAEMQVRLKRPALIGEPLIITSSLTKKTKRLAKAKAAIFLKDGTLVAECTATQIVIEPGREDVSDGKDKPKSDV